MKRNIFYFLGAVVLFGSILFSVPYLTNDSQVEYTENLLPEPAADSILVPLYEPTLLYGFEIDSLVVLEDKIRRNQSLSNLLKRHNVDHKTIYELDKASKGVFDVRKIAANKKITILCYPDSLQTVKALVYEPSEVEYVVFDLSDSVKVKRVEKKIEIVELTASGTIESSLAMTMDELGLSPLLTNEFADIFAWQIDFFHLYPGDRFKLIYEEEQVDGKSVGIRHIKGAYFEHGGNDYYAIHFDQGSGFDYFDEEGESLRKALLRYPVQFTRISSRFSGRRFHPVQKRWKSHQGTDFAAPSGTPIRSVGDGVILVASYGQFNGNYVKVKHNGNYTTGYLHMLKIASGVKPGVKVKQGQVIGYVGRTGLANGNHVCFRFWKNGKQVDAMKVELPPSEPILDENMEAFNMWKTQILSELAEIEFSDESEILAQRQ